jgi:hypothetical protein
MAAQSKIIEKILEGFLPRNAGNTAWSPAVGLWPGWLRRGGCDWAAIYGLRRGWCAGWQVAGLLSQAGLVVQAELLRQPDEDGDFPERTQQAFLLARKPVS